MGFVSGPVAFLIFGFIVMIAICILLYAMVVLRIAVEIIYRTVDCVVFSIIVACFKSVASTRALSCSAKEEFNEYTMPKTLIAVWLVEFQWNLVRRYAESGTAWITGLNRNLFDLKELFTPSKSSSESGSYPVGPLYDHPLNVQYRSSELRISREALAMMR